MTHLPQLGLEVSTDGNDSRRERGVTSLPLRLAPPGRRIGFSLTVAAAREDPATDLRPSPGLATAESAPRSGCPPRPCVACHSAPEQQ